MSDHADLIQRLRSTWAWSHDRPVNPDGSEAANAIEALVAERDAEKALREETMRALHEAEAEQDEVRALLREARGWVAIGRMFAVPGTNDLLARIDALIADEEGTT